ncbi:hypothetical protein P7C73_g2106, partial [Tremellales sp. Uapishka_1]
MTSSSSSHHAIKRAPSSESLLPDRKRQHQEVGETETSQLNALTSSMDMSDEDTPRARRDKGKGKMKYLPDLPEEIWTRIFEQYYDICADEWHEKGIMSSALKPVLLSTDHARIAIPILYQNPMISYHSIPSFIHCLSLPSPYSTIGKQSLVKRLTVRPSPIIPSIELTGDASGYSRFNGIHRRLPDLLRPFPHLTTFTMKEALITSYIDVDVIFEALKLIEPKKARLEFKMWDLYESAIGQELLAATKMGIHAPSSNSVGSLAPAPGRDIRTARYINHESQRNAVQEAWHEVLINGGEMDLPQSWLDPPSPPNQVPHHLEQILPQNQNPLLNPNQNPSQNPAQTPPAGHLRARASQLAAASSRAAALQSVENDLAQNERLRTIRRRLAPPMAPEQSSSTAQPPRNSNDDNGWTFSDSYRDRSVSPTAAPPSADREPAILPSKVPNEQRIKVVFRKRQRLFSPSQSGPSISLNGQIAPTTSVTQNLCSAIRPVTTTIPHWSATPNETINMASGSGEPGHNVDVHPLPARDVLSNDNLPKSSSVTEAHEEMRHRAIALEYFNRAVAETDPGVPSQAAPPATGDSPLAIPLLSMEGVSAADLRLTEARLNMTDHLYISDEEDEVKGDEEEDYASALAKSIALAEDRQMDEAGPLNSIPTASATVPAPGRPPPSIGPVEGARLQRLLGQSYIPPAVLGAHRPPLPRPQPLLPHRLGASINSPGLAHDTRRKLIELITENWSPTLQALSLVAFDPLASLIVRAPALDFFTRIPVPHIRVHLPRGCSSLAVFKGSKEVARDWARDRRQRAGSVLSSENGSVDDGEGLIVVGGDGHGGGLLHEGIEMFEIEVNTVEEMNNEIWYKYGDQLPAQVCRILVGEHDWRDLRISPTRRSPNSRAVHPTDIVYSPNLSQFNSPTFSFMSLDLDGEAVEVNELYDEERAEEQMRRIEERKKARLESEVMRKD